MSTLVNTTWTFNTQGSLSGSIYFQQVGPSQHAGVATITAADTPVGYQGSGIWTAAWSEASDGNNFAIQFNNFQNDPSFNPPPLGVPEINSGQIDAQLITLFGTHTNGLATVYGTNFGGFLTVFTMTKTQ